MLPEEEEPANHTRFDRKWSHMVEDKSFVVVNTGAHWGDHRVSRLPPPSPSALFSSPATSRQVAQLNRYTEMAKSVISFIDSFPHTTLIVRSSVPGHTGCSQYSSPLLEDDPESHNSYNWQGCVLASLSSFLGDLLKRARARSFVLFNTIWKDLLDPHPKHHYLDVGATSLRGDGHRLPDKDCLHYCLPGERSSLLLGDDQADLRTHAGPVDTWNVLLNHIIMGS